MILIVYAGGFRLYSYLYLLFTQVDPAAQKVEAELNASLEKRVGDLFSSSQMSKAWKKG